MFNFIVTTALKKLLKLKKRVKVVRGGTSASKTFSIIPILIDKAIREPNIEISVVSESIPHLRRGALKDFLKIIMALGRYNDSQFNKSTLKYTFTNGSYIEFFSVDQPDKLRGARRTILYVNECNNIDFESYYQLAIRTSGDIWLDYNPTSAFWVDKEILTQSDVDFITLTYLDNEALSETIVQEIEAAKVKALTSTYWANWWQVYGLGQTGSLEGVCITDWQEIDLPTDARILCYGMDFGYSNDPTSLVTMYKYNDAYIFDELIYKKGLLNSEISNLLKANNVNNFVYADSAEPKSIAELNSYGHNVLPVTKGKDSILFGLNLINQNKVYVTSRSKNLINELRNYIWQTDKTGIKMNRPIDAYNHAIDAMRYAMTSQLENPHKGSYFIY
ncbi:XtmB Phage terminase large subunit [uncultured Caudovirales phage]|uniref:XtmB Phage terminase large subunit n=3 Tax=uncultured Caudovirales phage TaxID=2100421 RepID=A0A6J5Q004_9CAUD|nr:XtmB Phage terminase large subunit [uncultured Caudovirales phage]